MKYTTNLNLKKPDGTDLVKIQDLNDNMETIDQVVAEHTAETVTDVDGAHGLKIEDGTFTPFIAGVTTAGVNTYAVQNGYYKKVGNICHVWVWLTMSAKDAAMSGRVYIGGLPFSPKGRTNQRSSFSLSALSNLVFPTGMTAINFQTLATLPRISLGAHGTDMDGADINATNIKDTTTIVLSGCYEIA